MQHHRHGGQHGARNQDVLNHTQPLPQDQDNETHPDKAEPDEAELLDDLVDVHGRYFTLASRITAGARMAATISVQKLA